VDIFFTFKQLLWPTQPSYETMRLGKKGFLHNSRHY